MRGVGRRRPPRVVFRLQPVDRDDHLQAPEARPLDRNRPHGARHDLRVRPAVGQPRQDLPELSKTHERLAADDRHVERMVLLDQRLKALDELVSLVVGDLPQRDAPAEVLVSVRVAPRAAQWTLARDLY